VIYPWQHEQWQHVQKLLQQDHLPHALLLSGLAFVGKKDFSIELAKSLLCLTPKDDKHACGECKACQLFNAGSHPDFHHTFLPDDKKDISIAQIRGLIEFTHLSHSISRLKVVVVQTADRMNINASNSVLKTLEEPAADTIIILESSRAGELLPTIRSRCQIIHFPLPQSNLALAWLQQQQTKTAAETLLAIAGGKPLLAIDYDDDQHLEQRQTFINDIGLLLTKKRHWIDVAKAWENAPLQALLGWQLAWVQDLIIMQHNAEHVRSIDVKKQLVRINQLLKGENLFSLYKELIDRIKISTHPVNKLLFIEDMLLCWERHKINVT
jgi:DNA polymerase-3 subunit delta'